MQQLINRDLTTVTLDEIVPIIFDNYHKDMEAEDVAILFEALHHALCNIGATKTKLERDLISTGIISSAIVYKSCKLKIERGYI